MVGLSEPDFGVALKVPPGIPEEDTGTQGSNVATWFDFESVQVFRKHSGSSLIGSIVVGRMTFKEPITEANFAAHLEGNGSSADAVVGSTGYASTLKVNLNGTLWTQQTIESSVKGFDSGTALCKLRTSDAICVGVTSSSVGELHALTDEYVYPMASSIVFR